MIVIKDIHSNELYRFADVEEYSDIDFDGLYLAGADFRGCDLSFCDFSGARVKGADFRGADLCGVDFGDIDEEDALFDDDYIITTFQQDKPHYM